MSTYCGNILPVMTGGEATKEEESRKDPELELFLFFISPKQPKTIHLSGVLLWFNYSESLLHLTTSVQAVGFDEIGTKRQWFWNEITKATYLIGKHSVGGWLKCLQDAVIAASPHVPTQACTFTKSHTNMQLFNFLHSNINTLITSNLNPSLKIPLKKSVAPPLSAPPTPPRSFLLLAPSLLSLVTQAHTFSWMVARLSVMTLRTVSETLNMTCCTTRAVKQWWKSWWNVFFFFFFTSPASVAFQKIVALKSNVKEGSHCQPFP